MRTPMRKLLIVGLDVGDGKRIREWARQGRLPTLGSLMERGSWSWLDTTADRLHVSPWPTIYTGTMPGEHGVYYTFQPVPGDQTYAKFRGDQYGRPTFWNLLSRAGIRCTVFDAPYTHPEKESRATQVFEWGTWAHHWKSMSTPGPLLPRLNRACGRYPLGLEALDLGLAPLDPAEMSERLTTSARAKADAAVWLMRQVAWDLFFVVFGETHPGAHYCWTPSDDATDGAGAGSSRLLAVYQEIDRGIGAILDEAGEEAIAVVVSGDGVGPNHSGWHLLPEVLRRLGFLAEPTASGAPAGSSSPEPVSRDPIRRLRDAMPKDLRKAMARRLPDALRHRLARRVDTAAIDWSKTRAYCLPTDLEGYIRINLKGREPRGIVSPGEDYRRICEDLVSLLGELTDAATGAPAVREVIRVDEAFPGPRRHHLPDLIVVWNRGSPLTDLSAPGVGTVSGASPDHRPGTHAAPGFLLQRGGSVLADRGPGGGHIRDLAPALLSSFGVPIPEYMSASRPASPDHVARS